MQEKVQDWNYKKQLAGAIIQYKLLAFKIIQVGIKRVFNSAVGYVTFLCVQNSLRTLFIKVSSKMYEVYFCFDYKYTNIIAL